MAHRPRWYLTLVTVAGTVAAILFALRYASGVDDPATFGVLAGIALLTSLAPVRLARSGGTLGFTLEGGAFTAMLLTGYAALAPLAFVLVSVVSHVARTRDAEKTAFNVGRSGLETTAAALVYLVLAPTGAGPTDLGAVLAMLAAVLVFEAINLLVLTELFHQISSAPRLEAAREVGELSLITVIGNAGYGLIVATVASVHLGVAVLAGLLMPVIYLGYRGYATALMGQHRADALNDMTHVLLDVVKRQDGPGTVLSQLVEVFGAQQGHLVVESDEGRVLWEVNDGGVTRTELRQLPRSGLLAEAMARGDSVREPGSEDDDRPGSLAAPIRLHGFPVGAVAVSERRGVEPWDAADASLLAAIANELAVALDNVALFRQVEEERARLEAESTKLHDILTAATDGIVSMRADGTVDSWNPGMANITGVTPEDAIGRPWYAVLRLKDGSDRDLAPSTDLLDSHMATKQVGPSLLFQVMRVDGEWRRLQCTISPVRGPGGDERGVVLVARDVTAEREVDELKSDFIATVSHELRTPLTPLKGFLTTLQNAGEGLSREQSETVFRSMGSQLSRLEALIADLLAVAELDRGQLDLHTGPVQLGQLVPHAVESEAGPQRDRCTVEVADVVAQADSVAIVRIVRSLVSNALKHTEGAVHVLIGAEDEWTTISVVDEGPGIPQWDQQRIFGRFDRLGNHLQRTQGPGLGLTIARSLAQRMGGDILLDSELGRGSTFTMKLPTARPRLVTAPAMKAVE